MQIAEHFQDLPMTLSVEVGVTHLNIIDVISSLKEGSVLALDTETGTSLDIVLNGTVVAQGECEIAGDRVTVRILRIQPR